MCFLPRRLLQTGLKVNVGPLVASRIQCGGVGTEVRNQSLSSFLFFFFLSFPDQALHAVVRWCFKPCQIIKKGCFPLVDYNWRFIFFQKWICPSELQIRARGQSRFVCKQQGTWCLNMFFGRIRVRWCWCSPPGSAGSNRLPIGLRGDTSTGEIWFLNNGFYAHSCKVD